MEQRHEARSQVCQEVAEDIFENFDQNGDGSLDFQELVWGLSPCVCGVCVCVHVHFSGLEVEDLETRVGDTSGNAPSR